MLFWVWFAVAACFGIAAGADILGNGPQAYLGGALTGTAYVLAHKLLFKRDEDFSGDPSQHAPAEASDSLTPPAAARKILDDIADQKISPAKSKRKPSSRRIRSRTHKLEPPSILERLRTLARRFR